MHQVYVHFTENRERQASPNGNSEIPEIPSDNQVEMLTMFVSTPTPLMSQSVRCTFILPSAISGV